MFFYVFVFTALRAAIMDYVLIPFARVAGVPIKKYQRFAEQSWACIYYTFSFSFGIVSDCLGKGVCDYYNNRYLTAYWLYSTL